MSTSKPRAIVGIDPGATGCLAVIDENREAHFVDYADGQLLAYIAYMKSHGSGVFMTSIEKVHAMPRQGVSSTFAFGQRLGELEGFMQALSLPYQLVPPKNWQKTCGIVMPAQAKPAVRKKASYEVMRKLYPNADLLGPKGGIVTGRVDALGIAHHTLLTYMRH